MFKPLLSINSMDRGDAEFLRTVSLLGCEVHRFDPSNSNASGGHPGNSLASNHGDGGAVSRHKTWLEWRAPKNRRHRKRSTMDGISQTLADIIAALGHRTVRQTDIWRNGAKLTYLWVFLTQHTREALLLVCSHSNRALRHPWLPWQQFKCVNHTWADLHPATTRGNYCAFQKFVMLIESILNFWWWGVIVYIVIFTPVGGRRMVHRRYCHPRVARALYVEISLYVITVEKEPVSCSFMLGFQIQI